MAHLWKRTKEGWIPEKLEGGRGLEIPCLSHPSNQAAVGALAPPSDRVRLVPHCAPLLSEQWILLAPAGARVRVNGRCVALGLHVLSDRDEIRLGAGEVVYFSTERLAQVQPFPGGLDGPVVCPRCRLAIKAGEQAVQCPNDACGAWYHEEPDRPCWSYAETCSLCSQTTALDAGFRWTPEQVPA